MSVDDARAEADALGVRHRIIPDRADVSGIPRRANARNSGTETRYDRKRTFRRAARGVLLMAISNKTGKMVLTTGTTRARMAVGYATLYRRHGPAVRAIKDVPKTLSIVSRRCANRRKAVIPQRIFDVRPPPSWRRTKKIRIRFRLRKCSMRFSSAMWST